MGFFDKVSAGLNRSRTKFKEQMNLLLDRGPDLNEEFWENLEEALILSDIGAMAADSIIEELREQATRKALPDAYAVLDMLADQIAETFTKSEGDIFADESAVMLFVGINGTGKTTTVGKIAKESTDAGRKVILGSADTFRAAAIEQLEVWAERAGVEMVSRERGSDPASVCYATLERAEECNADLVLIDTAGRLHTSADLMRELEKVVSVVRKRANMPVYTILVIDATTGQNGLQQAKEFNKALDLDALIVTKLDGTAKGGIALAISHELELPIVKIGVGEGLDDLKDFDAHDFAAAFAGDVDDRNKSDKNADDKNAEGGDAEDENAVDQNAEGGDKEEDDKNVVDQNADNKNADDKNADDGDQDDGDQDDSDQSDGEKEDKNADDQNADNENAVDQNAEGGDKEDENADNENADNENADDGDQDDSDQDDENAEDETADDGNKDNSDNDDGTEKRHRFSFFRRKNR